MRQLATFTLGAVLILGAIAGSVVRLMNPPSAAAVDCTQWSCSPGYNFLCSDHNSSCTKCGGDKTWCAAAL